MSLFSKSNRPTRDELVSRVETLTERLAALPEAIQQAKDDHARHLAIGTDATAARAQAAALQDEHEALTQAIAQLNAEIRQLDADEITAKVDATIADYQRRGQAIESALAAAVQAITRYNEVAGEHGSQITDSRDVLTDRLMIRTPDVAAVRALVEGAIAHQKTQARYRIDALGRSR